MPLVHPLPRRQRGISLMGLLLWAIVIGSGMLVFLKVMPTVNEYFTIKRSIDKVAAMPGKTAQQLRTAFDKQKDIEYSIESISGKDLDITKKSGVVVISFAYEKEIELVNPVYLLLKYEGTSKR